MYVQQLTVNNTTQEQPVEETHRGGVRGRAQVGHAFSGLAPRPALPRVHHWKLTKICLNFYNPVSSPFPAHWSLGVRLNTPTF